MRKQASGSCEPLFSFFGDSYFRTTWGANLVLCLTSRMIQKKYQIIWTNLSKKENRKSFFNRCRRLPLYIQATLLYEFVSL
jgi:hypothetical protein